MRIVDLTLPARKGKGRKVKNEVTEIKFELKRTFEEGEWQTSYISMLAHEGTHVDAPLHFVKNGASIDQVPLERLVGRGVLVDLSYKFGKGEAITDKELETLGGEIGEGDIPVLRTDQTKKWGLPDFYATSPYLTGEACQWLVNRKVKANVFDFSIDSLALDPIHEILLSHNVYNIEYVTNLHKLTQKPFTIVALPLKLVGVEGAPARVIAFENALFK